MAERTPSDVEPACVMFLCEASAVYLQPDKLYRFKVDPNCPKCVKLAKKAALPAPPIEQPGVKK